MFDASSDMSSDANDLMFAPKLRVELMMPDAPSTSWLVKDGDDVLETAESGEVLHILVDPGFHRIIAMPRGAPENAVLLFSGVIRRDISLISSVRFQ